MDYKNLTDREKNKLVASYENLIVKLTNQYYSQCSNSRIMNWDHIKSMALEGFAMAINNYDSSRSKMSFMQYAAFAMRNHILNCLSDEMRVVKLSAYAQKIITERGGTVWNTVSIDTPLNDEDKAMARDLKMGVYENAKFGDGDVFEYLYGRLEDQFSERDCQMFYARFGLNNFEEEMLGVDIAKMFGVSPAVVSNRIKAMTIWIRKDEELCEILSNLIQ